ncbi:MAG: hypothetical protein N2170_03355 [Bacteroidia bacterium]|nr:hypothetical protein [Bacteroidia bacterium]
MNLHRRDIGFSWWWQPSGVAVIALGAGQHRRRWPALTYAPHEKGFNVVLNVISLGRLYLCKL